jgi:arylsulfatase A-like enzyme
MSSLYPRSHGVWTTDDRYPTNVPTLAEELRRAGFTTIGISAMGNISSSTGFDKGFDEFYNLFTENTENHSDNIVKDSEEVNWQDHFGDGQIRVCTGQDINQKVRAVLNSHPDDDLFLFIWSIDTHDPYFIRGDEAIFSDYEGAPLWHSDIVQMNSDSEREKLKQIYMDMVHYADRQVGHLFDLLKSRNRYDDAIIVFCGDHGEAFGEHGVNSHTDIPFDEQVRVPLIGKFGDERLNRTEERIVELIDIYPTILDKLEIEPESDFIQGESFLKCGGSKKNFSLSEVRKPPTGPIGYTFSGYRTGDDTIIFSSPPNLSEILKTKDVSESLVRFKHYFDHQYRRLKTDADWRGIFDIVSKGDFKDDQREALISKCENINQRVKQTDGESPGDDVQEQLKAMGYI